MSKILFALFLLAIWPVLSYFQISKIDGTSFIIMIGITAIFILYELMLKRITEIRFDSQTSQILFQSENFFSRFSQGKLEFRNSRLEIRTQFGWKGDDLTLYFICRKIHLFKISKYKDGFSNKMIASIRELAGNLEIPVFKY